MVEAQQVSGVNYRFSKVALAAFQARIALYQGDWNAARSYSEQALAMKSTLSNLNTTNVAPNHYTSVESIMALDNPADMNVQNLGIISPELISKYENTSDKRFVIYFEKKNNLYKLIKGGSTNFRVSFRTAELYFIKSEALLKLNRLDEAKETLLTVLKNRYTASGYTSVQNQVNAMNAADFMNYIMDERFREFALEGHRWFDLRRTSRKKIVHTISGKEYILQQNDPRYTIEYPMSAKKNNPNL